jgi:hypothetical protein
MKTSIKKALHPGRGRCAICGECRRLEMWDDGLKGRFCSSCFDYVVDAEELLTSQKLVASSSEKKQEGKKRSV